MPAGARFGHPTGPSQGDRSSRRGNRPWIKRNSASRFLPKMNFVRMPVKKIRYLQRRLRNMPLPDLGIGDLTIPVPIIQEGMGVGIGKTDIFDVAWAALVCFIFSFDAKPYFIHLATY